MWIRDAYMVIYGCLICRYGLGAEKSLKYIEIAMYPELGLRDGCTKFCWPERSEI